MIINFPARLFAVGLIGIGLLALSGSPAFGQQIIGPERLTVNLEQSYDLNHRASAVAQRVAIGQYSYFYIDRDYYASLAAGSKLQLDAAIDRASRTFDSVTYPRMTGFLGDVFNPGIDNDPRVFIVLIPMPAGVGGYFNEEDEFSKSVQAQSNEHEMIFVNIAHIQESRAAAFIAHEFQHMITFNQKNRRIGQTEAVWLNELRSEFVPTFLGFDGDFASSNVRERALNFLASPSDSLVDWHNVPGDYGTVALLGQYMNDRFGPSFFSDMMASASAGIASIQDALALARAGETFEELYLDWTITNALNDSRYADGRYAYKNPALNLRITPTVILNQFSADSPPADVQLTNLEPYAPYWLRIAPSVVPTLITIAPAERLAPFGVGALVVSAGNQVTVAKYIRPGDGSSVSFVIPALDQASTATVSIASFGPAQSSIKLTLHRGLVPAINPATVTVSARTIASHAPFRLSVTGDGLVAGGQLLIGATELAIEPTTAANEFSVHGDGLAPGQYGVKIANPGQPYNDIGTLTVYGQLSEDKLYSVLGSSEAFIVRGNYWRPLIDARIVALYNQYNQRAVKPVVIILDSDRAGYLASSLVRAVGDTRIYSVDSRGRKHWLKMSAAAFEQSGRARDSVFSITKRELALYRWGHNITQ